MERAHAPDPVSRRQVEATAGYGVPETDIATILAVDRKTLRRHYRVELDTGHIKVNTKVAETSTARPRGTGASPSSPPSSGSRPGPGGRRPWSTR
jgi:hypothetical protein